MNEFEFLLHYISNNETGRTNFIESLSFFLDQEILFLMNIDMDYILKDFLTRKS